MHQHAAPLLPVASCALQFAALLGFGQGEVRDREGGHDRCGLERMATTGMWLW